MNWDRIERLIGSSNLAHLAQKRVGIVGLGSGGGFVALTLAMSGVGRFVLVDDDTLAETNIVRHIADRRYLGVPKAEAVADLIRRRNPKAEIEVRVGRVEQHTDALAGIDLLVPAVDAEGSKYTLNQLALAHGLTAVYAGVYERGEGGDVVVVRPYDGPCYACWAATLREGLSLPGGDGEELDYGTVGPDGTLEAEPGLWLHVARIAAVQADLILNELLRGTSVHQQMPGNTVIMANRALEIMAGHINPPYTAVWADIPRDPGCLVCGEALHGAAARGAEAPLSLDDLMAQQAIASDEED